MFGVGVILLGKLIGRGSARVIFIGLRVEAPARQVPRISRPNVGQRARHGQTDLGEVGPPVPRVALRSLARIGPIRGPRPEKVSARFLSRQGLRRSPVLVVVSKLTQEMGFSSAICLSIGSSKNFAIDTSSDSPLRLRVLTMNSRAK